MSATHRIPPLLSTLAGFLLATLAPTAGAAVINVPGDQPNIQAAMTAAGLFGDEIVLADGTYTGASNRDILFDKHVTVRSASGDPTLCIIDCESISQAFRFAGVVSAARLESITIYNGRGSLGGGINFNNAAPTVINCRIVGNLCGNGIGGGGVGLENNSSPNFINCEFSGNKTGGTGVTGGAVFAWGNSTPTFTNCSFSANTAWGTSAISTHGSSTVTTLVNCVVWGHATGHIQANTSSTINITYSDIQYGYAGAGNISVNPGFIDADGADNVTGTPDDDLLLGSFSPCTDAGDNGASGLSGVTTDARGGSRFFDDTNVADTGSGSAPLVDMGANERQQPSAAATINVPGDAATIQAGIDLAQLGDEVVLANGTFTGAGNRDLLINKDITLRSASGDPTLCIIDCQDQTPGINVVQTSAACLISGITITNGVSAQGGGINISESDVVVLNCRLLENLVNGSGGGGVAIEANSSPSLINCTLIGNTRAGIGVNGGGAYVKGGSTPVFANCVFTLNNGYDASAIQSQDTNTVTTVVNSIVWGNLPGTSGIPIKNSTGAVTNVTYSVVQGGYAGTGNLATNPIFADTDYRIAPISPCLDAGSNAAVTVAIDCDGNPRIHDGDGDTNAVVDMGAFEYGSTSQVGVGDDLRAATLLLRAWPNPARTLTHVSFRVVDAGPVSLTVFDVAGRRVATLIDEVMGEGEHVARWDGRDQAGRPVGEGVYFLRLMQENGVASQRLLRIN